MCSEISPVGSGVASLKDGGHHAAAFFVKMFVRLVQQQKRRIGKQRSRHFDALHHAGRKRGDAVVHATGQPHGCERLLDPVLLVFKAARPGDEPQILPGRKPCVYIHVRRYETGMQRMRFLRQPGPVHAERDGSCGRQHHPGQNAKQGGLTGPVDAGHGKALSAGQGKRKLPEKEPPAEPAGNAAYVQNRQSIPGPRHSF